MLSREGRQYMEIAPRLAMWPGVALTLVVYCLNMVGDALRDLLDPRLRGGGGALAGGVGTRAAERARRPRRSWNACCVLLDQRHYLREAGAGKGSCQPAVECGQPSAACGRQRCKVKVGDLSITLQAILDGSIQGGAQRDVIRPERMSPRIAEPLQTRHYLRGSGRDGTVGGIGENTNTAVLRH